MLELRVTSVDETHAVARALASLCRSGDVIVLSGEMGAGKTAFAQGFGRALGIDEPITSPTYTLVHSYDIDRGASTNADVLHHADLYRLERTDEVADLGLAELAEYDGVVLIEWGEVAGALLGDHLVVQIGVDPFDDEDQLPTGRLIEISATGPGWAGRWSRIVEACEAYAC